MKIGSGRVTFILHPSAFILRDQRVTDVPQAGLPLLVLDLQVRDGRLERRRPVDQVGAAVDQAIVVESLERRAHGPRQAAVEREALARPVARRAQAPQLAGDLAAVLLLPLPGAPQKLGAPHLLAAGALAAQ